MRIEEDHRFRFCSVAYIAHLGFAPAGYFARHIHRFAKGLGYSYGPVVVLTLLRNLL